MLPSQYAILDNEDSNYTKNIQMQMQQTQKSDGSQEDHSKHIKITEYGYPSETSFKENINDAGEQRRNDRTPKSHTRDIYHNHASQYRMKFFC